MGLTRHSRHTRFARVVVVTALVLSGLPAASAVASPVTAPSTPTSSVEAALSAVEARAASASARALDAATIAADARAGADAAAERADTLRARAAEAEDDLSARHALAGIVAVDLVRTNTGGALLARVLADADPETFLSRLSLLDRMHGVSAQAAGSARAAAGIAASLRDHAEIAAAEHTRLAAAAEADAQAARAEADAEAAEVAAASAELDILYARLAAERRTTVAAAKATRLAEQTQSQAQTGPAGNPSAGGGMSGPPAGGGTAAPSPLPAAPSPQPPAPQVPTSPPVSQPPAPQPPASTPVMTPAEAQAHARGAIGAYGWGADQFSCLVSLWNRESGWRVEALNRSSGAYGIPQSWPAEKMAAAGPDWRTNGATQIAWGLGYITARHGSPCGAWAHSERTGWY